MVPWPRGATCTTAPRGQGAMPLHVHSSEGLGFTRHELPWFREGVTSQGRGVRITWFEQVREHHVLDGAREASAANGVPPRPRSPGKRHRRKSCCQLCKVRCEAGARSKILCNREDQPLIESKLLFWPSESSFVRECQVEVGCEVVLRALIPGRRPGFHMGKAHVSKACSRVSPLRVRLSIPD